MRLPLRLAGILFVSATIIPAAFATGQTAAASASPAQTDAPPLPNGGPPRGGPDHRVEMLQQALNLTPDQTTQVKALFEAERSKMDALRSDTASSREERHTQMMAIHGDTTAKMHALLSTEQATKYDSLEARMRERRQDGGNAPPPPPGGPGER